MHHLSMFEHFKDYITARALITDDDLELMRSLCIEKKMSRRQLLLHEGEVCRYKVFVAKGLLRTYHAGADGAESIMRFAPENWWCVEAESYNAQTPTRYNIDALEESEVIMWTRESVERLFAAVPAFKSFSDHLVTTAIGDSQNRVLMNISYTAEEKYRDFITSFPDVYGRVPLHMVASYLGVSRETLSRIRRAYNTGSKKKVA